MKKEGKKICLVLKDLNSRLVGERGVKTDLEEKKKDPQTTCHVCQRASWS